MGPEFTGILVVPSVPMLIIVYVGFMLVAAGGTAVYMLNRSVLKREANLPMVTTAGIRSPLWSLIGESPQSYYCTICNQAIHGNSMKVYFNKADPQTLLIVGTHHCGVQHTPQALPAVKRKPGLRQLRLSSLVR